MNKRDEQLDRIAKSLLDATKVSDGEIEKIVSNPNLFDSVLAKIDLEEQQKVSVSKQTLFNWHSIKEVFSTRRAIVGAFASLVLFVLLVNVVLLNKQKQEEYLVEKKHQNQEKSNKNETAVSALDEKDKLDDKKIDKDENQLIAKDYSFQNGNKIAGKSLRSKYVQKANFEKSSKLSSKRKKIRKHKKNKKHFSRKEKQEEQKVFYSLPFNSNSVIESEHLQVVKTELSRSELFALGVNLQLENNVSTIKTELLIGEDGVARAIRVVEKF